MYPVPAAIPHTEVIIMAYGYGQQPPMPSDMDAGEMLGWRSANQRWAQDEQRRANLDAAEAAASGAMLGMAVEALIRGIVRAFRG